MMPNRARGLLLAGLCTWQAFAGVAHAADSHEFWPELNLFYGLNERTRLHVAAAYADGKESDVSSFDGAAYLDVSLKPIIRRDFHTEDWQRGRYLWTRIGYVRVFDVTDESGRVEAEDRGVVSLLREGAAARRESGWRPAPGRTCAGSVTNTRLATVSGPRRPASSPCASARSCLTSISSGSTTRATTAGPGRY